jgi:nitrite reductase/ring-hydroxylating ferredoxin subunit
MAADTARLICDSTALLDSGRAVRFEITGRDGKPQSAIALRYQGRVYGYVNACRHIPSNWICKTAMFSIYPANTWCAACTARSTCPIMAAALAAPAAAKACRPCHCMKLMARYG